MGISSLTILMQVYIYTFTLLGSISLATKQPALSGIFTTPEEAS